MNKMWLVLLVAVILANVESQSAPSKPTLQVLNRIPYVSSPSMLSLNCVANTNGSQHVYKFYQNGQPVLEQNQANGYIIVTNSSQSGNYTCTVSNSVGSSPFSDGVMITVVDPPTLVTSNNAQKYGDPLNLTCDHQLKVDNIQFQWYKDYAVLNITNENVYRIASIGVSDEGEYFCLFNITNTTFVSGRSKSFVLLVAPPGRPSLQLTNNVTLQGQQFELNCMANSSTTATGLEETNLYFNDMKIGNTFTFRGTGPFIQTQTLFRNTGNYSCSFTNKFGESSYSPAVFVSVQFASPQPRRLISSMVKIRGQAIDPIGCSSQTGFKQYYCVLYLNKQRYQEDKLCSFTVPHGFTGAYSCSAANVNGVGPTGSEQIITFVDMPKIKLLKKGDPSLNQSFTIQCVTDQNTTSVKWYSFGLVTPPSGTDILSLNIPAQSGVVQLYCTVPVNGVEIWSNVYYLFSSAPSKPTLRAVNEGSTALERVKFSILCLFYCSYPTTGAEFYTLYKDGVRVLTSNKVPFKIFRSGQSGANYTCTASNIFGESEHSSPVYVQGKDEAVISASAPKATLNQNLTLTCSVQNPSQLGITYSWYIYRQDGFDGWKLLEEKNQTNLTFSPVTQNNTGYYICETGNDGKGLDATNYYAVFTSLPMKPQVTDLQTGSAETLLYWTSQASERFYNFICACHGTSCDPQNPFKLYKDGKEVTNSSFRDQLGVQVHLIVERTYSIDYTIAGNEGNYTCTAINSFGESEHSANVTVTSKEVLKLLVSNPNATLFEDITFTCDVPPGVPDVNIQWKKSTYPILTLGRTLTLSSLDREDDGGYSCSYTNRSRLQNNYKTWTSKTFYLILHEPLQPLLLVEVENENLQQVTSAYFLFGVGDTVNFKCISQQPYYDYNPYVADNDTIYILYKNGQQVNVTNARGKFSVSLQTAGFHNYTCKARNRIGDSHYSYMLSVKVNERPTISASSSSPTLGTNLTLTCNTKQASDGSDIIWRKNNKTLPMTSASLSIAGLTQFDEGRYSCRQKIGPWYHPVSDDYYLLIGTKAATPEIFILSNKSLDTGSYLRIYCLSASSTSTQAVFYKNGNAVKTVEVGEYDDAGQVLFTYSFLATSSDDSGGYTCTVQNRLGVSQSSSALAVTLTGTPSSTQTPQVRGTTPNGMTSSHIVSTLLILTLQGFLTLC